MAPSIESSALGDTTQAMPQTTTRLVRLRDLGTRIRGLSAARTLLVIAALLRIWTAIWDQGLVWPDEIFQTLEQAHRFAFGRGIIPWEFRDGARSWLYPGLIGLAWKVTAALGMTHPLSFVRFAKLGMAAMSVGAIWAGMRLARHHGGKRAELLAALFGTLCPPLVIFGARCTTETASAPFIVAIALLIDVTPNRRRAAVAGALAALIVLFRYQNGLISAGFFLVLWARRRWIASLCYAGSAIVVAGLGGLLDKLTWGSPFKPLVVYWKFTFAAGGPGHWGTHWGDAPVSFFADHLAMLMGLFTYSLLVLGIGVASRRTCGPVLVVVFFVTAHCAIPHKEMRFITPVFPLAVSLAAIGLADLMDGLRQGARPTYVLAFVMGAQMVWLLRAPTLGDVGYGADADIVWHANEDYYRATLDASAAPDLCGISYVGTARAWTGGYTYLHRNVPVFFDTDARNLAAANYLVGTREEKLPVGWTSMKVYGKYALFHRDGGCGPVPKDWTLDML